MICNAKAIFIRIEDDDPNRKTLNTFEMAREFVSQFQGQAIGADQVLNFCFNGKQLKATGKGFYLGNNTYTGKAICTAATVIKFGLNRKNCDNLELCGDAINTLNRYI